MKFLKFLFLSFLISCQLRDYYVLGVFTSQKEIATYDELQKIAEDLSKELKRPVKLYIGSNYEDVENKLKAGFLDFAFVPSLVYIEVSDKYEMVLKFLRNGKGFYRGQFVVLKDIDSISQLKNKNWAFPDKKSTSGYLLPKYMLLKMGINPDTFFNYQYEAGSHDKAIELLIRGNVQLATTFEDVRERMKDKFPDIFEKTKILLYTDSIPNDGFAINRNIKGIERDKIIEVVKNVIKKNGDLFYRFLGSKEVISASDSDYNILRDIKDKVKQ